MLLQTSNQYRLDIQQYTYLQHRFLLKDIHRLHGILRHTVLGGRILLRHNHHLIGNEVCIAYQHTYNQKYIPNLMSSQLSLLCIL